MKKIKIFGIETEQRFNSWKKEFACLLNDCESGLFVSLETFKSEGDDSLKDFEYVYAIECVRCCDSDDWYYSLQMVPKKEYIKKEIIEDIASYCGITADEVDIQDIVSYGSLSVTFGCTTSKRKKINYDIITKIAHVYRTMDALRGFFIDKTWNAMGSNGWDILCHALNGDDLFKPALERYKERSKTA